jgi:hypothetical protein
MSLVDPVTSATREARDMENSLEIREDEERGGNMPTIFRGRVTTILHCSMEGERRAT